MTVPLDTVISLGNLKRGKEEWFNVQDPVRFALESIIGHVQEQSRAIAKLEQSTAGLADKTSQRWASSQALETLRSQVFDSQAELARRVSSLEAKPEPTMPECVTPGHLNNVLRQMEDHFGREVEVASRTAAEGAMGALRELEARLRAQADSAGREVAEVRRAAAEQERLVGRQLEELAGRVDGVGAESAALRRQLDGLGSRVAVPDTLERRFREASEGGVAEVRRRVEELAGRLESTAAGVQRSLAEVEGSNERQHEATASTLAQLREKVERASSQAVEVERRLASGLADLQVEWQAASASLKTEVASACDAKCNDAERRVATALSTKIETTAHAAQREAAELRRRIAELEREKVDKASMEKFTGEVLDAFDSTNAANMEELANKWDAQLVAIRTEIATQMSTRASSRDAQATAERVDDMIEGFNVLRLQMDDMEREARTRDAFCTKDDARRVAQDLMRQQELQREQGATLSAVQKASDTASAALEAAEAEGEKVRALADKLAALTEAVFGRSNGNGPFGSVSPAGGSQSFSSLFSNTRSNRVTPASKTNPGDGLVRRFEALESFFEKLTSEMGGKLSAGDIEQLKATVAEHSSSMEELTSISYRRVEELAAAIQSLHKVLASNFADRPTLATVTSMIDNMASKLVDEETRRLAPLLDHTHTVEHAERILIQEDGTRVTVDSGPLEGVKVTDDGRVSTDVWQRLSRLESQYERVLRGQEELMGQLSPVRFRTSPQSGGGGGSGSGPADAVRGAMELRQRVDALERAHDNAVYEIKNVQRKLESAHAELGAKGNGGEWDEMRKKDEERWEVMMDRLGYILDGKAGKEAVEALVSKVADLERQQTGGARSGLEGVPEGRLRALLNGKAEKEEVDAMFQSIRKALDAKPSYSEMQSALKSKLDIQTFLDRGSAGGGGGSKRASRYRDDPSTSPAPSSAPSSAFRPRAISPHQARSISPPTAATGGGGLGLGGGGAESRSRTSPPARRPSYTTSRSVLEEHARSIFSSRMSDAPYS